MYGVGGERELDEHVLDHLTGYEGARPVRIGNDAYEQEQHDVWGALLDSVYLHTRSRDSLDERDLADPRAPGRDGDRSTGAIPTAASGRSAASPSTSPPRRCSAGSRATAASRLAEVREDWESVERWRAAADEIHADISSTASTTAACSSSTTTRPRSTRRCC